MLVDKTEAALPGKFEFTWNVESVLKETVPA